MPDEMNAIKSLPDISFIDNKDIDQVRQEMVADYESFISEATGQTVTLERSSVHRMELYAAAAQIYQAMQYIDRQGKQSILKYSYSDFLDNLAIFKGVTRNPATPATTTLRFTLSAVRDTATGIPQGTRVSTAGATYFATDVYAEIPAGSTTVDVPATEGGAEIESDDDLAERVFLAPGAYSTAGPEDGYLYHAKAYSAAIGDVVATSNQAAGTVDIVFIMADGSTPGEEMIEGLEGYLQGKTIRPMTDLVRVAAPQEVQYTINLTYYINRSDSAQAVTIQQEVAAAVEQYKTWQRAIGRDINPSQLVRMVMDAGAQRVTVTAPTYTTVDATKVSALQGEAVISYGGLEDD